MMAIPDNVVILTASTITRARVPTLARADKYVEETWEGGYPGVWRPDPRSLSSFCCLNFYMIGQSGTKGAGVVATFVIEYFFGIIRANVNARFRL